MTVHRVLALSFQQLAAATLADKEETAITGQLVDQMRVLVASRTCPKGAQFFSIHDDRPESADGVEGRHRPRIDIVVERTGPGPRPQFHFEAKRLTRSDSVAEYVGSEGIGCFLSNKYAKGQPHAGMLGYVQRDSPALWARRIAKRLAADDCSWVPCSLPLLPNLYQSNHVRAGEPFALFHVLLVCM